VPSAECISLVEALGRELPEIGIGKVSFSQTIHWQPNYGATSGAEDKAGACYKKTRHENHFAAIHEPVFFRWRNAEFTGEQHRTLKMLLAELAYFGRAESLCHAELCDAEPEGIGWCCPTNGRRISASCHDVFCPIPDKFQFTDLWLRRADLAHHDPTDAPQHFVDALLSSDLKPDGADWFSYKMPEGWPQKWIVRTPRTANPVNRHPPSGGPKVAHYLRFSLQCKIPIPLKFTVPIAETFRAAAIKNFSTTNGVHAPAFALTGHDKPEEAQGDHQHAFYLPLAARDRERAIKHRKENKPPDSLDELHVWCPYGFTQAQVEALMRVQSLYWGSGKYPVRPVLLAIGDSVPKDCPIATGQLFSRVWQSRTPFVPPRYFYRGNLHGAKLKIKDSPEFQLLECLKHAGMTAPGEIHRLTMANKIQTTLPPQADWDVVRTPQNEDKSFDGRTSVCTHSPHGEERERRIGFLYRIVFQTAVAFPFPSLGHSAHFGLGLFVSVEPEDG
jgi:CRISPR-associated protein Csb2